MKSSIQQQLTEINDLSAHILEELQQPEPSLESVNERMRERAESIDKMDIMVQQFAAGSLTGAQEEKLQMLFEQHATLNDKIQQALEGLLNEQREKLGEASRKRKADDQYRVLKKPDISYF